MRLMSVVSALLVLWLVPPAHAFQGAGSAPVDETEPVAVPEPSEAAVAYYPAATCSGPSTRPGRCWCSSPARDRPLRLPADYRRAEGDV